MFARAFYKNNYKQLILILFFMFTLHWLWIITVKPVPTGDGQSLLYTPLQSYLHLAAGTDLPHSLITELSHNQGHYPTGFSIPGLFGAKSGLGSLFMSEPFYYTFFLLLPLSGLLAVNPWRGKSLLLKGLLLFSFPAIQISLRSFSPHGFNVIFSLSGAIIFLKGWQRKAPFLLISGFLFLWFSAVLKHLGLWLGAGLLFTLIFWSVLRKKHVLKACSFSFFFLLSVLPWYPLDGFMFYMDSLSQFQKLPHAKTCAAVAVITLGLTIFGALKGQGKRKIPHCFANGLLLLLIFKLSVWCITKFFGSQLSTGLNTPTIIIMSSGYAILLLLPHFCNFHSERGFLLLFTYISLLNAAILYFSRFGNNPAIWYFPACMVLYMTMREIKNSLICVLLSLFFGSISNFLPSFPELMQQGSPLSVLRHQEGWSTFPNHHLSWQKHELRTLREEIYKILSEHEFKNTEHNTGFFRFMDGHLVEQSGLFYQNWYQPFPVCRTLSFEYINLLKGLSEREEIEDIFSTWLKEGLFSYIIAAIPNWSKDPLFGQGIDFYAATEHDFRQILSNENPTIERDVEGFFWDYLQKQNRLENNYHLFEIGQPETRFQLYLCKDIPKNENAGKIFRQKQLQSLLPH